MRRCELGLVLSCAVACACGKPGMHTGGSTGDFGGSMIACTTGLTEVDLAARQLDPGVGASKPGFSGQEMLDFSLGRYQLAIRWVGSCLHAGDGCAANEPACRMTSDSTGLADTKSVLSLDIEQRGDMAVVTTRTSGGGMGCAREVRVPVHLRLTTADAALNEVLDADLTSLDGRALDASLELPVSTLKGRLGSGDLGLPADAELKLTFQFHSDRFSFEAFVVAYTAGDNHDVPAHPPQFPLGILLDGDGACTGDLPRSQVDLTAPTRVLPPDPPPPPAGTPQG